MRQNDIEHSLFQMCLSPLFEGFSVGTLGVILHAERQFHNRTNFGGCSWMFGITCLTVSLPLFSVNENIRVIQSR